MTFKGSKLVVRTSEAATSTDTSAFETPSPAAENKDGNTDNTKLLEMASGKANAAEPREFLDTLRVNTPADDKATIPHSTPYNHASSYTQPFLDFINENPTVFHTVAYFESKLHTEGFIRLSEREDWTSGELKLERGGRYFVNRNGSSLMAFVIGENYTPGRKGVGIVVGHIDSLTARVKPVSKKPSVQGYTMLGVAPYAGALSNTWMDRDLGIGGKVIVKQSDGKIASRLVKLGWPIARIPTLAPHFGLPSGGALNKETQMVPIIGIDGSPQEMQDLEVHMAAHGADMGTFASTQPPRLVQLIANELGVSDYSTILNWELELFDTQTAVTGGMNKEFIFAPRIDDKLCSWSAVEGLIEAADLAQKGGSISLVGLFDDEEIGSRLRQGAAGNFLPSVVERIVDCFAANGEGRTNLIARTYANSFMISADVTHAVNPNFVSAYLADHMPKLNVGVTIAADSNGHMTTDSISTSFLTEIARRCGSVLQTFQIRNDTRSGGTVGPMLSSAMGVRAIDAGLAQLSMHSIRATVGALDPGLGAKLFRGFYEFWEEVDEEFRE